MFRRFVPLIALTVAAGCEPPKPKTAPVSGVASYKGKPLPRGEVVFVSQAGGPTATGPIGPDGKYTLTTFKPGDGAVLGPHKVMVMAFDEEPKAKNPDLAGSHPNTMIPEKYNDYNKSGLTADVKAEPNTIHLELK